jgi:hypothetical protein
MSRLATGACVLLLAIAVALQVRMAAGVLRGDLAASNPPAHFTTGVMVHDYLRSALGSNPVSFAESFYVRFPKVAVGQWPPVYFALQAAWYLVFPISPASARFLSAAIALTRDSSFSSQCFPSRRFSKNRGGSETHGTLRCGPPRPS